MYSSLEVGIWNTGSGILYVLSAKKDQESNCDVWSSIRS
jgi:hypothetical protein